jgi:selenocysteine lyase/cysteine desulfurase
MGIRPRSGVRKELVAALREANVYVSVRGDSLRIAPHVYNTKDDIARLLAVLGADGQEAR